MYWPKQSWFDQLQKQLRDTLMLFVVDILKQSDYFVPSQVTEMRAKYRGSS